MQNGPLTLTSLLVATVAFLMTLLPMIPFVQHFPLMAPFSMFANDTFYYLDVARNSQGVPFYTFDGTHATNGFHPVWQFLLYFCVKHRWIDLADPAHGLVQLFYFNLAILSAAVFGLALAASRYLQHKWLALLTVCPGWLWFLMAVSAPGYLANWSYLNGMETAVELFFLACVLLSYRPAAHPLRWLPVASFFLGMMVLSRLDDVFFLLPVLGWIVMRTPRSSRCIAVLLSSIPFVMIAAYLLYNVLTVGRAMPISGAVKAGLALHENLRLLLSMFAPVDWNDAHNKASVGFSMFAESYMRIFQMTFPLLVSALYLARWRAAGRGLLDWLCVGVLLKGGYNFFFVSLFSQGHWYYGVSVFVANLVLSVGLDYALVASAGAAGLPRLLPRPWRYAAIAGEILLVLFSMNAFIDFKLNAQPGMQMQLVLERRAQVAQMVRSAGGKGFIEFDDGILGFATDMGSLSGFGLVSDAEARSARKHGHFLDLAVARGDQLVLSRGGYANQLEGFSRQAAAQADVQLDGIHSAEFREYALQPVATDGATDVRLYRLVRRQH